VFFPDLQGGYHLYLKSISASEGVSKITQAYFDFLADTVRLHPWGWQGWQWYCGLPLATPQSA